MIIMPSSGNLARKKQAQNIRVGNYIVVYEKQFLLRDTSEEIGQLICDEMKLKEDILINVVSNKMLGFTKDFISAFRLAHNQNHTLAIYLTM